MKRCAWKPPLIALLLLLCGCGGGIRADMQSLESPAPTQRVETPAPTPTPAPILLGDCDGDGVVTAADAAILLRNARASAEAADAQPANAASHRAALPPAAADVTQNGVVDETDVRAALWIASGRIPDTVKFVERISTGLCDEALFDRFSYTGTLDDGAGNYASRNVSVRVRELTAFDNVCFVADICVQDVRCLATAFADGVDGGSKSVRAMAKENDAILAVNGDFSAQRDMGPIIRNGLTVRRNITRYWDIGLVTYSGELITFPYRTLTNEKLAALSVYQSWVFGPELLDEQGKAKKTFHSAVTAVNPRTVLGYYAPGHYAFLVADGRQSGYARGLTMEQLSSLCEQLGFCRAYNLDGGRSSVMATPNGVVNHPYANGRAVSDIVYIREWEEEE